MPTSCDLRARPYKCGCSRYCKILRPVSKTTFYAHAKYRELDHRRSSNRLICGSRTHWLSCGSVASMSSTGTGGCQTPGPSARLGGTGPRSHTTANGKRARLDSDDRVPREQPLDDHPREDESMYPMQDDNMIPDPSDQEPRESPQMGALDTDGGDKAPHHEPGYGDTDPLLTMQEGSHDADRDAQHLRSPPLDDDDNQQGDGSAYPGPDAQPDDLPGGPNDWNPDNIVPHLEALHIATNFIDGLSGASLDNDPIPADVRERLRSPFTEPISIDRDLRLSLKLFLGTIPGSQASYESVCSAVREHTPGTQTLSYDRIKRTITELTGVVPVCYDSDTFHFLSSCDSFTLHVPSPMTHSGLTNHDSLLTGTFHMTSLLTSL